MKKMNIIKNPQDMKELCNTVRQFVEQKRYQDAEILVREAMGKYPHEPEPHNLIGLLLELQEDHLIAMKHFRAAWALDPTYLPARHNLEHFGSFCPRGNWAFAESDCPQEKKQDLYKVEYDKQGIGHIIMRD